MFRYAFLRTAALALTLYGVLGIVIAAALLVVGASTFRQVAGLARALDQERGGLVLSLRTASRTVGGAASGTADFQRSVDEAAGAAESASRLAHQSALSFRDLAQGLQVNVLGVQPFAGLAPQFSQSADQLEQLAGSLGSTRDALRRSGADIQRVGADLGSLRTQLDGVAATLEQAGGPATAGDQLLPFQVAFYGMCLLVILQSLFSFIAGVALFRLGRALGSEPLVPIPRRGAAVVVPGQPPDRLG